ncbi:hypothetical protein OXYTRIMIC_241 [Oxytricha trifallax]|uniref:Uncharacterized protein n=1 Tax=Oxytricha trifallax TaxID=1172189 RepID=A0A073HZM9_9SPIT|nr:hypothetical protein OXYTRIMIC_241 [Oxytricha trifallax]
MEQLVGKDQLQRFESWQQQFKLQVETQNFQFEDCYFNFKLLFRIQQFLEELFFKKDANKNIYQFRGQMMNIRNPNNQLASYKQESSDLMTRILQQKQLIPMKLHFAFTQYIERNSFYFIFQRMKIEGLREFQSRIRKRFEVYNESQFNIKVQEMIILFTACNLMIYFCIKGIVDIESADEVQYLANLLHVKEEFIQKSFDYIKKTSFNQDMISHALDKSIKLLQVQEIQKTKKEFKINQSKRKPKKELSLIEGILEVDDESDEEKQIQVVMMQQELQRLLNRQAIEQQNDQQMNDDDQISMSILQELLSDSNVSISDSQILQALGSSQNSISQSVMEQIIRDENEDNIDMQDLIDALNDITD